MGRPHANVPQRVVYCARRCSAQTWSHCHRLLMLSSRFRIDGPSFLTPLLLSFSRRVLSLGFDARDFSACSQGTNERLHEFPADLGMWMNTCLLGASTEYVP